MFNKTQNHNIEEPITRHDELAYIAAQKSMVLLKNEDNALPISNKTIKSVALIGPQAQATNALRGNYMPTAPFLISPQMGIENYTKVTYALGCEIDSTDKSNFDEAIAAAESNDVTIMVMGIGQKQESEGHDRTDINLPGVQNDLIREVSAKAKGSVIVVIMSGSVLDIYDSAANNKNVSSIIWCGYPGQSGGDAIADVIFGRVNPGGRTPLTWYFQNYTKLSMYDMGFRPNTTTGNPGRTYRFFDGPVIYPYGHGLSYTTWDVTIDAPKQVNFNDIQQQLDLYRNQPHLGNIMLTASVSVKNTGNFSGDYVVQCFAKPKDAGKDGNPLKFLYDFDRIYLTPGQSTKVSCQMNAHQLSLANPVNGELEVKSGQWQILVDNQEFQFEVVENKQFLNQ